MLERLWTCVQVGEMKALRRISWTNLPNHLRVMMVRNVMSKWEIIWLQMKRQSKFLPKMMAATRDSVRMNNILIGNNIHLENNGRITFYLNMVKGGPIVGWSFEFVWSIEIRRASIWEARNVKGIWLVYGQQYVGFDHGFKGSQECRMQIGVPYQ